MLNNMDEAKVLEILQKVGSFRAGHFVFVSGLHADTYVNKNAMYPYTHAISELCRGIAEDFKGQNIDAVVGPATGGIILSQWVAFHLREMEDREIYSTYADKDGDGFVIKRGYDELIKGKNVLVVEDLVTTGSSLRKVIGAARIVGANVQAAVAVCNRGAVTREMVGEPPVFKSLLTVHLDQWPAAECDLCKQGIPINTDVGHGKEFLAKNAS